MTDNEGFIEQRIIEAVRRLLAGRVNEILSNREFLIPVIEFGIIEGSSAVTPIVSLSGCERTEKERIVRLDAYSVSITFTLQEHKDGEMFCYAYSCAVGRAFYDDPTIGGIADRAIIIGKKYIPPKKLNCGEGWGLVISLRVTVEGE